MREIFSVKRHKPRIIWSFDQLLLYIFSWIPFLSFRCHVWPMFPCILSHYERQCIASFLPDDCDCLPFGVFCPLSSACLSFTLLRGMNERRQTESVWKRVQTEENSTSTHCSRAYTAFSDSAALSLSVSPLFVEPLLSPLIIPSTLCFVLLFPIPNYRQFCIYHLDNSLSALILPRFPILPVSFLSFIPFIHFPFLLHSTWLPIPLSHISDYSQSNQSNQSNIVSFRCDIQDLPASLPVLSVFCHYFSNLSSLPLVSFILLSNSVTMRWVRSSTCPVCVLFEQTQLCALRKELLSQKPNRNRSNRSQCDYDSIVKSSLEKVALFHKTLEFQNTSYWNFLNFIKM